MSILFCLFGAIGIVLFYEGVYLPIVVSVLLVVFSVLYLLRLYKQARVGPLTILLFVVYALPFIHVVPYLWFDFDVESPLILWGLAVNPYMIDKTIIELMSMIGAIGAVGFAVGASLSLKRLSATKSGEYVVRYPPAVKTLSLPIFCVWIVVAVLLTWVSAPTDTVFTAAYTESKALNENWNFSAAWMVSYAFLVFALADSMFESSPRIAKLKRKLVLYSILLVVVWFQLLRGDRESLTFVFAALLMYHFWGGKGRFAAAKDKRKSKWPILILGFVVFVAAYFVGIARSQLIGVTSVADFLDVFSALKKAGVIRFDNLITGTWSAVLLGPLSIAGDYINGTLSLKYGQNYLDLLGSAVPGFLADWIGYTRPIDGLRGPAWEMTYGLGGTHAVVVPFIDFRMTGVFVVVALWSFAFAKIEHYSIKRSTVSSFALLGIVAMVVPHWLWYGEKNIMNALIIWLVLSVLYRLRLDVSAAKILTRDSNCYHDSGSNLC